jgi:hypothetical protein
VRDLAARARDDLDDRVDELLRYEQERFDALVDEAAPAPEDAERLRAAVAMLADARRAAS